MQFTATGTFNIAPTTVTPLSVTWCPQATCGVGTPVNVGITIDGNGLAQCEPTFSGTVTIVAEAPRNPGAMIMPMSGMNGMVSGTAQIDLPVRLSAWSFQLRPSTLTGYPVSHFLAYLDKIMNSSTEVPVRRHLLFALLLFLVAAFAAGASPRPAKIETLPALADKSVSEAVRQSLDAKGYKVLLDDGTDACELWLRKPFQRRRRKMLKGSLIPSLQNPFSSAYLHFSQASTDYRGEAIPAGYYTLRYALLPNDGNHLGAAPNRDFLLLIPADSDSDPSSTPTSQELVSLSRKATGTKHPAPLSLVQPDSTGTAAAVSKDDQDHWIFSGGLKLASGDEIPFALVVKGDGAAMRQSCEMHLLGRQKPGKSR